MSRPTMPTAGTAAAATAAPARTSATTSASSITAATGTSAAATTVSSTVRSTATSVRYRIAIEVRLPFGRFVGKVTAALDNNCRGRNLSPAIDRRWSFPTAHLRALLFENRFARQPYAVAFDREHLDFVLFGRCERLLGLEFHPGGIQFDVRVLDLEHGFRGSDLALFRRRSAKIDRFVVPG